MARDRIQGQFGFTVLRRRAMPQELSPSEPHSHHTSKQSEVRDGNNSTVFRLASILPLTFVTRRWGRDHGRGIPDARFVADIVDARSKTGKASDARSEMR